MKLRFQRFQKDLFLVYKPKGVSSAGAVAWLKKQLKVKKAGHAGTLDKEAQGLLIVGIGKGTKRLNFFQKLPKEYVVKIKLGVLTDTDDISGRIIKTSAIKNISLTQIKKVLSSFLGATFQTPPLYSAVKIKGKPAYKLARQGKKPKLKPRKVMLFQAQIIHFQPPYLVLHLKTGKGFYVRSLARDLGQKLGCGATVVSFKTTKIGNFSLSSFNPQHSEVKLS
jgi:tRNA pseudouridine55 synthase